MPEGRVHAVLGGCEGCAIPLPRYIPFPARRLFIACYGVAMSSGVHVRIATLSDGGEGGFPFRDTPTLGAVAFPNVPLYMSGSR
jgi:hypothetical protein